MNSVPHDPPPSLVLTRGEPFVSGFDDGRASANICASLWASAHIRPDHVAVSDGGRTWTYAELKSRAAALAVAMQARGVERGDRVAIFLDRSGDAAASIFAVHAVGAIGIVISERFRPRQVEYVLTNSGASVLVTSTQILARQPRAIATCAEVLDTASVGAAGSFTPIPQLGGDIAQILYTSGSTGLPKGVAFTHCSLGAGVATVAEYLGLKDWDRVASLLPFSSVYGLNQLLCCVRVAGTLIIENSPLPSEIVTNLREQHVSVAAGVPPLWLQLLAVPAFVAAPLPDLRIIQNAGGHCPREAVRKLRAAQPHAALYLQYGMTETFRSTFLPPEEVDRRPDSMGRPMPGVEILVVDDDGRACGVDEVGELVHSGPTIACGYWGDPEGTARVFRPHPFRAHADRDNERVVFSGDLVRRDKDGFLYYVSRRDRIIKTLGFRVGPDEIVDVLFASGQVREVAIMTEPDEQRGERIIAFVSLADSGSKRELERFCRTELPRHMQPTRIELRETLARLASGKYDMDAIRNGMATSAVAPGE